jgi:hypothetical protein
LLECIFSITDNTRRTTKMTKRKNQFVNSRGQVIDTDDDVCPPGFGIRTSMMMLDGLDDLQREIATRYGRSAQIVDAIGRPCGNRPGHAFMSMSSGVLQDAAAVEARDEAFAELEKRSAAAWRTVPAADALPDHPAPDVDAQGRASDAYEAAKVAASNRWRSPAGRINPAATKARVFENNWAASYAPYMKADAADGVDARDAAFAALVARSESAWRMP